MPSLIEMQPNFAIKAWRRLTEHSAPWSARRQRSGTVSEANGSASTAPPGLALDPGAGNNERDREMSRAATVETFAGTRLVEFRRLAGPDRNQR